MCEGVCLCEIPPPLFFSFFLSAVNETLLSARRLQYLFLLFFFFFSGLVFLALPLFEPGSHKATANEVRKAALMFNAYAGPGVSHYSLCKEASFAHRRVTVLRSMLDDSRVYSLSAWPPTKCARRLTAGPVY